MIVEENKMRKSPFTTQEIMKIMNDTKEAYSRERYGEYNWAVAVNYLTTCGMGYNVREIIDILKSKYMRWAADCGFIGGDEEGDMEFSNSYAFPNYMDKEHAKKGKVRL
jgi:hypothetical protein